MVDDLGAEVRLPERVRRVVSLVPSITESVALTAPDVLVGITDYCVHPPDLTAARVGGSKFPDVAAVLALEPDLVLANEEENREQDVVALREAGVAVWTTAAAATVPDALAALRRMFTAMDLDEPAWLTRAGQEWDAPPPPAWATAVVCVWRRPWVVLGRDTFAGDVLRRLGVANAMATADERYPRPTVDEVRATAADLVVLPDEPYPFSRTDGPEAFPGRRCALIDGRHLTWWGPSLLRARAVLAPALRDTVEA